jgi:small-conductance mechanosensitive channel
MAMLGASTPLTDIGLWARSSGLEIVLFVTGAVLLTRFASWLSGRITARIDAQSGNGDSILRTEGAKHRHAVAQVVTWAFLVVVYCLTAVLVAQRFGVPLSGFVAPATVVGVALGFGAQRIVQDVLSGFFMVAEHQYGFGDLVRLNVTGVANSVTGTVEEVTLRITRVRTPDGEVVTTPNGQIVQVINLSRDRARVAIDVPVPASADVAAVSELLARVGAEAYDDPDLHDLLLDPPAVMAWKAWTSTSSRSAWSPAPCPASSSRSAARCGSGSPPRCCGRGSMCPPPWIPPNPPRRHDPAPDTAVHDPAVRIFPGHPGPLPARAAGPGCPDRPDRAAGRPRYLPPGCACDTAASHAVEARHPIGHAHAHLRAHAWRDSVRGPDRCHFQPARRDAQSHTRPDRHGDAPLSPPFSSAVPVAARSARSR